jgi:hypothetical protein
MIINNLYLVRPRFSPDEADSVPIIDADTMLTASITGQRFEFIPWRNAQLCEFVDRVKLIQFSGCDLP